MLDWGGSGPPDLVIVACLGAVAQRHCPEILVWSGLCTHVFGPHTSFTGPHFCNVEWLAEKTNLRKLVRDVPFAEPANNKHDYAGWAFNIEIS